MCEKDDEVDYTDLNPLDYVGNMAEYELQRELRRLNIKNDPCPSVCAECGAKLESGSGMVGETVLYCPNGHGIKWEDQEGAIRRVF